MSAAKCHQQIHDAGGVSCPESHKAERMRKRMTKS